LAATRTFDTVGVWSPPARQILVGDRDRLVAVMSASSTLLAALDIKPQLGRLFTDIEDDEPSTAALLSHSFWQALGAPRDIVGRTVTVRPTATTSPQSFDVVGVLAPDARLYAESPDIVLPIGMYAIQANYPTRFLRAIGRLSRDTSIQQASDIAASTIANVARPDVQSARVLSLHEDQLGSSVRPLWMLFGGATVLLLVACSSVAGLLLGDARAQQHAIAMHIALGATKAHVIRALALEYVLLALAASVLGTGLAVLVGPVLLALTPVVSAANEGVFLSGRVLLLGVLVSACTPFLFGFAPLLSLLGAAARPGLQADHRFTRQHRRFHRFVVSAQVSLALVLVVGASMFAETTFRMNTVPLGFAPERLAIAHISVVQSPSPAPYQGSVGTDLEAYRRWLRRQAASTRATQMSMVLERVKLVPGVSAAAGTTATPFLNEPRRLPVRAYGTLRSATHTVLVQPVTVDYFDTMMIRMESGRAFRQDDRYGPPVVVVSATLARELSSGHAGQMLLVGDEDSQEQYSVVGVATDVRQRSREVQSLPLLYVLDWHSGPVSQVVFRATEPIDSVVPLVRQAIEDSGAGVAISSIDVVDDYVSRATAPERFRTSVAALFGATALVLAAVGLYGLASRQVSERRREVGVRAAMGASPSQLRHMIVKDTVGVVVLGLGLGAPLALVVAVVARSLLFGVAPGAVHLIATSSVLLIVVALLATALPAQRAARTDPCVALRNE
jgi:predicted permease